MHLFTYKQQRASLFYVYLKRHMLPAHILVFLQPHAAGLQGNVLPGARPHAAAGQCTHFTEDLVTVDNMQAAHTCFMSTCLMQVSSPPSFTWSRISSTRTPVTGPSVSMTPTSSFSRTPETNPSVPLGQAIVPQQQQDLDTTYKVVKAMLAHSYMAIDSNRGHQMGDALGHFTCTTTPCFPMKTFLRHLPTVPPQRIEQILGPGWDNGAFIHQRACLPWQQGSATITTATYMLMTRTLAAGLTTTARHSSRMQPCSIAIPWLPATRSDAGSVHAAWSLATFAGTCTPYASWPRRSPRWSGSWYHALTKTWFRPLRVCHQHHDGTAAPSPLAKHTYALRALRFRMASQHGKKALLIDGSFSGLLANTIAHSSSSKGPPFDHKHCGYPIHEPEALWKPPAAHPEVGSGEAGHNAWPAGQLSCQCGCIRNAGVGVWMWGWGMWGVSGHAGRSLAWAWYLFQFPIASNPPTDSARLQQQQQQESAKWLCSLWAPEASPTWHVHNGPQGSREKVADHQALEHFLTL